MTIARGKTKETDAKDIPIEAEKLILENINKTNQSRKTLYHKAINSMRNICYKEISRIIVEKKYKYPCLAGKKYCTIYQDGSVHTCEILQNLHNIDSSLGRLQDFDFDIKKLLASTNAQNLKTWITSYQD